MKSVVRDLVEYHGLAQCLPLNPENFRQINVEERVCLPCAKPNIEQLVKVYAEANIVNTRIIRTPKGTSLEGLRLTGYKLIVEGEINQKIQYVANEPEQTVHTAHFAFPFTSFIVLPENFNPSAIITTSAFIEDIYAEQVSARCIYKNVTLLLTAEIC